MQSTPLFLIPLAAATLGAAAIGQAVHEGDDVPAALFSKPIRLAAAGEFVKVEAPGYAAPAWTDVNGDGHKDLVVGQFNGGKMKVYHGNAKGELAAGEWMKAGGEIAEVPGVW